MWSLKSVINSSFLLILMCLKLSSAGYGFSSWLWWPKAEMSVLQHIFDACHKNQKDPSYCLKNKAATAVERALSRNISLTGGLVLVKNRNTPNVDLNTISNGDPDQRIAGALNRLIKTHTLTLDLTKDYVVEEEVEEDVPEGRGDKGGGFGGGGGDKDKKKKIKKLKKAFKKMPHAIMGMAALTAVVITMTLQTLAFIAGKALLASKIALVISGMITLKKIFSSDHHESSSSTVQLSLDEHRRHYDMGGYYSRSQKEYEYDDNALDPYKGYYYQR